MRHLVLGGMNSGKSAFAEKLALESDSDVVYIATALARDEEMKSRVSLHKARRPAYWTTLEEPFALASVIDSFSGTDRFVLVDCLTLWLTNLMCDSKERLIREEGAFLTSLANYRGDLVLVSNELGLGVIPENAMAREFIQLTGRLHQRITAIAEKATFVMAGLPQTLK